MSDDDKPTVDVVGKLADRYAALESLRTDMTVARETLAILRTIPETEWRHGMALWAAVVVSYGRAFKGGYRAEMSKNLVPKLNPKARDHEFLILSRDKYVAHLDRDSRGLQSDRVFVILDIPPATPAVSISWKTLRWATPEEPLLSRIEKLITMQEKRFAAR